MLETVKKTFFRKFVLVGILTILMGAVITVPVLYVYLYREPGSSYAESFTRLATLRGELLFESIAGYIVMFLFVGIGITIISLLYSFRVAGPVHRLGIAARKIASGDLTEKVNLRKHDVIDDMADDLNELAAGLKEVLIQVENRTKELKEIAATRYPLARISAKKNEIQRILSNIKV